MSAVLGVNATLAAAGSIGSNIIDQATVGAVVKCIYDEYEASGLATASTITMGTLLPVGARILHVRLSWDDMGSTVTMKVGDAGDDDRYIVAGTSLTTANGSTDINAIAGFGYVITGTSDTQIVITTAGIWTGTLKMIVEYAI
jgi:hypothetical protein